MSCRQNTAKKTPATPVDSPKTITPAPYTEPGGMPLFVDFGLFMDSMVSKKDMVCDTSKLEVSDDGYFDKEEGPMLSEPRSMHIGKEKFLLSKFVTVNHNESVVDESAGRFFEFDSAFSFSFNKHKYAWIRAHYRDCNGTGCMIIYELLADFSNHCIHLFVEPELAPYCHCYAGDVDGNGRLGILVPGYIGTDLQYPYGESMLISLTPWILNSSGYFEQKKDGRFGSALIGQYTGGDIRITGEINWSNWKDNNRN